MTLRRRVSRVRAGLADRGLAGRPFLVVWEPDDPGRADDRPPGVYRRAGVIEVVYTGEEPDPDLRARVRELAAPASLELVLGPEVVSPPDPVE